MTRKYSDIELERIQKIEKLRDEGIEPYTHEPQQYRSLSSIRQQYEDLAPDTITDDSVVITGRVMFKRGAGKIGFATLQEGDGTRLQVMLAAQDLGREMAADETYWIENSSEELDWDANLIAFGKKSIKSFDKTVDLGDFIEVEGLISTSIKGELSVRANNWKLTSKSIRPLPFLHSELSDEARVRQPYVHLIQSQEARDIIRARSRVIRKIRDMFEQNDFMEVETPVIQPVHGGALARPFNTHVNALDDDYSLRISLELNLKKLVVGGLERVFEIGKVFRNEGIDTSHNPEFTLLEAYQAYGDMYSMASLTEDLIRNVSVDADAVFDFGSVDRMGLNEQFQWLSVYDGVSEAMGISITSDTTAERLRELAVEHNVSVNPEWSAGKIVMELCSELVEPTLDRPTFLYDWPAEAQPLARRNPEDSKRVLAWDLIINGMEVATSFTELIDPILQREILTEQSLAAANGDPEAMELDEDFLRALEYAAPPMGGLGIGIDRLVMLITDANIREVVPFPLLKREVF